jgi:hypothetical protein
MVKKPPSAKPKHDAKPDAEPLPPGQEHRLVGRDAKGKFKKGVSGNPQGTKPGSRHRASLMMETIFAGRAEKISHVVAERAEAGEPWACALLVRALVPQATSRPVKFQLGKIEGPQDIPAAVIRLAVAASEGLLTPEEAAQYASLLSTMRESFETRDLLARIEGLEQQIINLLART